MRLVPVVEVLRAEAALDTGHLPREQRGRSFRLGSHLLTPQAACRCRPQSAPPGLLSYHHSYRGLIHGKIPQPPEPARQRPPARPRRP
jgi:hypothetical protein